MRQFPTLFIFILVFCYADQILAEVASRENKQKNILFIIIRKIKIIYTKGIDYVKVNSEFVSLECNENPFPNGKQNSKKKEKKKIQTQ